MANVTVKYKGAAIATMDSSGTKTMKTSGKYCEGDIVVEYTEKPTPSGTKSITENGTYDVTEFAAAEVDVQPTNFKQWTYTSAGNNTEANIATLVPAGDEWVKAHYADENLVICVKPKFKCAPGAGLRSVITLVGSNRALCSSGGNDYYSMYTRYINDDGDVNAYTRTIRLVDASTKGDIGDIGVTAGGKIFVNMTTGTQYMLQAGEWSITAFLL